MRGWLALALLSTLAAGCASWPFGDAPTMLARADRLADRQEYEPALRMYDEFLVRYAADPATPRAQKSRDAVASILAGRAEVARLRSEVAARDAELAKRDAELARLRQETERLRADLEKLKDVDLNLERKKR